MSVSLTLRDARKLVSQLREGIFYNYFFLWACVFVCERTSKTQAAQACMPVRLCMCVSPARRQRSPHPPASQGPPPRTNPESEDCPLVIPSRRARGRSALHVLRTSQGTFEGDLLACYQ